MKIEEIEGIGDVFGKKLEKAGVRTVDALLEKGARRDSRITSGRELAHKQPAQLHKKLEEVNSRKHLVRRVPSTQEVEQWITEARGSTQRIEQ